MRLLKRKRNRPLLVVILGSGPAGLFAAQAVYDTGNIVQIYARGTRSTLYGAQYLHQPVPGLSELTDDRHTVEYILKGTATDYRRKVYGDFADGIRVSPEVLMSSHDAWDIRAAYDHAWDRFGPLIIPTEINTIWLDTHARMARADLIVWSLPLNQFCIKEHGFGVQEIWAQGDAPDLGRMCSVAVEPWTVITNGEQHPGWYRAANVFGHRTAEWPIWNKPPIEGVSKVMKPIFNRCECWMEMGEAPVLRVGRYGTWTKGELSHEAYFKTRRVLEAM